MSEHPHTSKIRALSEIERFYIKNNVNSVVVSQFTGKISSHVLQNILQTEIKRHPLLAARIQEEKGEYYFCDASASINDYRLTTLTVIDPSFIRSFVLKALNKTLDIQRRLFDFTYIIENNNSTLISVFHHAVSDEMCAIEIQHNIIQACRRVPQKKNSLPIMQPVEYYFPKSISPESLDAFIDEYHETTQNLQTRRIEPRELNKDATPKVNIIQKMFTLPQTARILDYSKQQGVSVHGIISAAHLFALKQNINSSAENMTLCFHTPMNIRSRLEPNLSPDNMFTAAIQCTSCYTLTPETTFLMLAQDVEQKLNDYVKSNDIFRSLLTFNQTRTTFKIPTALGITNLGIINVPVEEKSLLKLDGFYLLPAHALPMLSVSASTFNQQLLFNYVFAEPYYSEAQVNQVAESTAKILNSAMETTPLSV